MNAYDNATSVKTLSAFIAAAGVAVPKKAVKAELLTLANGIIAAQTASAVNAAENGVFRFPKASDFTPSTAVAVVDASGTSESASEETEAQAAARIESEAQAENATAEKEAEKKRTLSDAIAETWKRPAVRAKRLTKDTVQVTVAGITEGFSSVWQAFDAYNLPPEKHIRFRGKLKSSRKETFSHAGVDYIFEYDAS
jgi:hypothetical protein